MTVWTIEDVTRQVRGDFHCDECSPKLRETCIRERAIQIKMTMDKEGWDIWSTERIFGDLCPLSNAISQQYTAWGEQIRNEGKYTLSPSKQKDEASQK